MGLLMLNRLLHLGFGENGGIQFTAVETSPRIQKGYYQRNPQIIIGERASEIGDERRSYFIPEISDFRKTIRINYLTRMNMVLGIRLFISVPFSLCTAPSDAKRTLVLLNENHSLDHLQTELG